MTNLQRKTLTGTCVEFEFKRTGSEFLVKNFGDSPILVNFEEITSENESESVKIPGNTAQIIFTNQYPVGAKKTNRIFVSGTGEVEVQLTLW